MKWLKKWFYLIMLVGCGFVYLSCVDEWKVYSKVLSTAEAVLEEIPWQAFLWGVEVNDGKESPTENPSVENPIPPMLADGDDMPSQGGELNETIENAEPVETVSPITTVPPSDTSVPAEPNVSREPDVPAQTNTPSSDVRPIAPGIEMEFDEGEGGNTPKYMTVEDDYFADAVFIGDSRTVGMFEYGGLEDITTFYASEGITIYELMEAKIVTVPGQKKKITVEEALQQNSFKKVYLMLGINELGGRADAFAVKYEEVVAYIRELQPDATIYLQSIMNVSAKRSAKGDYINNESIAVRNESIAQLADNEKVFYLDINPPVCDENGYMIADYTFDGVHLKAKYIELWKQFLKEHAIAE